MECRLRLLAGVEELRQDLVVALAVEVHLDQEVLVLLAGGARGGGGGVQGVSPARTVEGVIVRDRARAL